MNKQEMIRKGYKYVAMEVDYVRMKIERWI